MDEQDDGWLSIRNQIVQEEKTRSAVPPIVRKVKGRPKAPPPAPPPPRELISEDDFERVMDTLERESLKVS